MLDDSTTGSIAVTVVLQIRRTLVCLMQCFATQRHLLMISWQMHMRLGHHLQQRVPEHVACDVCHSRYVIACMS